MDTARILIIDEDAKLRKTLGDILMLKGYQTTAVDSGEAGLAFLQGNRVNLVLVDLGLADLPGLEVLTRVKEYSPPTSVIVLSGQGTVDSAVEATSRGAFSYLVRPYDLVQLINHITRAIEKQQAEERIARHLVELERMNAELMTLHEVSKALSSTLDLGVLVDEVLKVLVRASIFPFELRGGIFLMEGETMRLASFVNLSESLLTPCQRVCRGECLCGRALSSAEVVISEDDRDIEGDICHPGVEHYGRIVVPLQAVDTVVGLLSLYTEPGTRVSESLMQLLSSLGSQIGIAINNARLYQEARSTSLQDPLTGLANRRFLEIQLDKCFDTAQRYGQNLSVVMLDIDHFKRYNDQLGHQQGDCLLVRLGGILLSELRKADYLFRYGGEEFLALLPDTDLVEAADVAERLRSAVQREAGVTISLGVSEFREPMPDKESLVAAADAALYRAKKRGRNRVELA